MTVKTLIKHGRSYALVIPRALLQELGIEPDTPLKLSAEDGSLKIEPIRPEVGPNHELIRERKKFHVRMIKALMPPSDSIPAGYTDDQISEIKKIAKKNVYADTAPLTKFEQSIMLEDVLDDLLAYGPLTPYLFDEQMPKIFMSFDHTLWSEGQKLPILYDSAQHAEDIFKAIQRQPHGAADEDGWVAFELGSCRLFVPELLLD